MEAFSAKFKVTQLYLEIYNVLNSDILTDEAVLDKSKCRMDNCFDLSFCRKNGFTIYVYPQKESFSNKSFHL